MTVGELIEELKKHPAHHSVVARYQEGINYDSGMPEYGLGSIEEVRSDQAFAHHQPLVIIDAGAWCK